MTRVFPGRTTPGLRRPPAPADRPRASVEEGLRVLRLIQPWAAPRLPDDWAACFDAQQRQIRPLPAPPRRYRPLVIPFQRRSNAREVRRHVRSPR
jgi:hypothetical protein